MSLFTIRLLYLKRFFLFTAAVSPLGCCFRFSKVRELTLSKEARHEEMLQEDLRRAQELCEQDERAIEERQIKVWKLSPRQGGPFVFGALKHRVQYILQQMCLFYDKNGLTWLSIWLLL